jgi:hypothetical protein
MLSKNTTQYMVYLKRIIVVFWVMISAAACISPVQNMVLPTPVYSIQEYTPTVTLTTEPTVMPTATINPLVTLTPTPDPFTELYLESLKQGSYGGGVLQEMVHSQ